MSDKTTPTPDAAADTDSPAAAPAAPAEAAAESAVPARLAELEAAVADLTDRLLRSAADMENLRRRTEREIADARQYAVTGFARDLLSVGDNLRRALEAIPAEVRSADAQLATFAEGVELTERELLKALSKHGVEKLDPVGQKFDPNFHQAIFEVESADQPAGTVVQVVQAGYSIADRVLRPAMVGIAKAAKAKPAAEAVPAANDDKAAEDTPKSGQTS